ncbi:hypothetical protein H3Z83_04870 [Tenacibaculum sp. S7007]|uniref:Uncharacterized protein n=1 Tax=Tenacibaculum pelagium TaxID=2759527 RepID=A0A839AMZ5_9FLAO|nr:hypothetical protein [Tenacibaculum pelagium]MBA6155856.1 hypothetical protein [Tenacibaculum pelagium]
MRYQLKKGKLKELGYKLTFLFSIIILIDFFYPGTPYNETIIDIKREKQQYYNAGGNSHSSYRIFTHKHNFTTTTNFAKSVKKNQTISYVISPIFQEVNSHFTNKSNKNLHSLRLFSGLIMPAFIILIILGSQKFKWKIENLIFILQILLIGNLFFLMN